MSIITGVIRRIIIYSLLLVVLLLNNQGVKADPTQTKANIPSPQDLINAVNKLRATYNRATLKPDSLLINSAQKHSEYQAFIGTWSHSGPGGSNETDRAIAAGYGGGKNVICDEAVAMANTSQTVDYVVNNIWSDSEHKDLVLLNERYVDIGAGVAEKNGMVYYTVDVCVTTSGQAPSPRPTLGIGTEPTPYPAVTVSPQQMPTVITVTPQDDGSIIHIVQSNETIWSIAIAYNVKSADLCALNGISCDNPIIYAGQKLIVRRANTPTLTPTITPTPRPPTRTPRPTKTASPTRETSTITSTPSKTLEPLFPAMNQRSIGIGVIVISTLGILVVVIMGIAGDKKKTTPGIVPESETMAGAENGKSEKTGESAGNESADSSVYSGDNKENIDKTKTEGD